MVELEPSQLSLLRVLLHATQSTESKEAKRVRAGRRKLESLSKTKNRNNIASSDVNEVDVSQVVLMHVSSSTKFT